MNLYAFSNDSTSVEAPTGVTHVTGQVWTGQVDWGVQ